MGRELAPDALRTCTTCKVAAYSVEECAELFIANKKGKYGFSQVCKNCHRIKGSTPQARTGQLKHHVMKHYGISLEQYFERLGTNCEVCGKDETLCYDHCHTTGSFRGTLCRSCNKAIGQLGDNYQGLLKAAQYLKRFEDNAEKT